jgi:hypothetical protein
MRRVPTNTGKPVPHIEGEPDFYEINKMHPLLPPDREGHCFSPLHAAGQGSEATKLSTMQEPAASEAALCVYPTSIAHRNFHYPQSCWSNHPTYVNHEFVSKDTDMALSMSHLHMAAAHANAVHMDAMHAHAGQKTMPTNRELTLSRSDGLTPYDDESEMNSKQQAIQAPSSQTYIPSSECDSMPTSTLTTTTYVDQHGTPNYSVLPLPSNNNYQQYPYHELEGTNTVFPTHHFPLVHPAFSWPSEDSPAWWTSSSTSYYTPPPPPDLHTTQPNPLLFDGRGVANRYNSFHDEQQATQQQEHSASALFAFEEMEKQKRRDADQVSRDQRRGNEDDVSNEDPPDEFFGAFDF